MQTDHRTPIRGSRQTIAANMPFVALYPAARLALWGLRYWATCARQGRCPALLLRDVFVSAGAPLAPLSIDRLMRIFAVASRHPPALGCPACTRLTDDEAELLSTIQSIQGGEGMAVERVLSAWLPWQAAEVAGDALTGYARLLLDGGYDLSSARVPELTCPPAGARLH
ncbi:hypothetical protein [Niveispirillum sp.]|uniref:hypothetical protein n=1 Tax=Niveispirillum sp. TaxID=1917217 RepID=UPI001B5C8920|nr:hypothetical protein [Niveispirillum sp.]MBP7339902.1 hypothetical protein [Niveispirillum sp.]